ncbi:transcriptional regulator, XRE family [Catenulispora acidiphila DSM 44928]|uniref:Transcriptional regulator, XRE family n=1 Tax=Catenulispora acidiphila (strain DSM 44928 / JCM 14897 / NBRC 102108 / NRRL B-24433 / ID139908) TaxID=479433 RepID=C7QEJ9_CATAD|nr:helix-turn-helix transcriptional regulator [Catenulispora acidiphila]ACU70890.1 transcriptional regulator, XRE family [Catenulispora acidiphila DSM 44928]
MASAPHAHSDARDADHAYGTGGTGLGDFLRSRRAAVDPLAAGMPDDGRLRRVPGLRREELAMLAHVSVDYIVRLEQGRTTRVSRTVLDALADALQLAPDERAYLFTVADVTHSAPTRRPSQSEAAPRLHRLLDTMTDIPAIVVNHRMDVLAWNRGAAGLLTDFSALPPAHRNMIRLTFLDESFRTLYADWPRAGKNCVATLRMEAGSRPNDPALNALVGELSVRDQNFRTWWATHQVRGPSELVKTYNHPLVGTMHLDVQQFSVDTHPDQKLIAFTAEPGSESEKALQFLLQWSDAHATADH